MTPGSALRCAAGAPTSRLLRPIKAPRSRAPAGTGEQGDGMRGVYVVCVTQRVALLPRLLLPGQQILEFEVL